MKRGTLTVIVLLFTLLPLLRTGSEIDEHTYIISVSLDAVGDGQLRVSLQFPTGNTNGDSAMGDVAYSIIQVTAAQLSDAVALLNATVPRRLNYTQVRQVVIGQTLAMSDAFEPLIQDLLRIPGFRQTAVVLVTRDSALHFIQSMSPYIGLRLSKYIEIGLKRYHDQTDIPLTMIGELGRTMAHGYRNTVVIYAGTNTFENTLDIPKGHPLDALPGQLPREAQNPNELLGAVLLNETNMVGTLTGHEMQLLALLQGTVANLYYEVNGVTYHIRNRLPTRFSADWQGESCSLTLNAYVECYPMGNTIGTAQEIREALETECDLLEKKLQAYGVDPIGFTGVAVRHVWSLQDWDSEAWRQAYQNASTDTSIYVTLFDNP